MRANQNRRRSDPTWRLLQAGGEPVAVVRAAAEKTRALSTERGAHAFARRSEEFMAELELTRD